jgi:nitrogen fixation protein FixH
MEIERKNMIWGWALLGLFLVLFGGTIGVAYIYLWLS